MPELPEVETTRRGLEGQLVGRILRGWVVRNAALRWPVEIPSHLAGGKLRTLSRRAKYLLFEFSEGLLILHLGMSGSLRLVAAGAQPAKHDHLDMNFSGGRILRFNDPRRFGSVLWWQRGTSEHPLLARLGVEPLGGDLTGAYLKRRSRGRKLAVKNFIMDSRIVVGVGNIYAAEALFIAGIRPAIAAGRLPGKAWEALAAAIRKVLEQALEAGGTTLRDFVRSNGRPGYFQQRLNVYGRGGKPCRRCGATLVSRRIGARATVFCRRCQS